MLPVTGLQLAFRACPENTEVSLPVYALTCDTHRLAQGCTSFLACAANNVKACQITDMLTYG